MVSFSKPIQPSTSTETNAKRKRNPNPKLIDENNVDKEAIKRRKLQNDINLSASVRNENPKGSKHTSGRSAHHPPRGRGAFGVSTAGAGVGSDSIGLGARETGDACSGFSNLTAGPSNRKGFIESESLDDEDLENYDVGRPKKPNSILEAADGSDDDDNLNGNGAPNLAAVIDLDDEEEDVTEDSDKVTVKIESAKEELGHFKTDQKI